LSSFKARLGREEEDRMYEIDNNKRRNADLLADKERLER
jgi:hypothetical protein